MVVSTEDDGHEAVRRRPQRKKRPVQALPGVWENCAKGDHELCAVRVQAQEPWATAGDPPPTPDAKPLKLAECECSCHHTGGPFD